MKIAVIGAGNVGTALALAFKKAGHQVLLGVKDPGMPFKGKEFADQHALPYVKVMDAVDSNDVVVLCTPAQVAGIVAATLGDVSNKVLIDTMNAVFTKPDGFSNTADAVLANCNCKDLVKCFNTTGFENMSNPIFGEEGIDMFVAGDSEKGKAIAMQLAKDIGFAQCYDFGGNDKFHALEQLAFAWINLAIIQKLGRNIAFKVISR